MLLDRKDEGFPEQLKQIRLDLKMNCSKFAIFTNICKNSPKRFEDRSAKNFAIPHPASWESIKKALNKINYFSDNRLDAFPPKKIKAEDIKQNEFSVVPSKVVNHPKNFLVTCFKLIEEEETV